MSRLRLLAPALLALGLLAAPGPASGASPRPPAPVTLTSGWTFQPAGGVPVPVTLPHVFDPRPLPRLFHGTTGTYRLTFTPPPLPPGFAWALHFEQVRRVATVTLNGSLLGVHRDPYVPFTLPATPLRPGGPDQLEVLVDNRKGPQPREGWWNWGGITRPVELVPEGPLVLHDPGVLPQLRCTGPGRCTGGVLVDGWIENRSPGARRPTVALTLRPPGGGPATTARRTLAPLAPGATRHVRFAVPVRGPLDLWAPGHPARYDARVRTLAGTVLAQDDRLRIGLRSIAVRAGRLELNGRPLQLRGASIQEDMPGRGPALRDGDFAEIVRELRAVHADVTRAHYLLNERLLDRLDAAGILVWTQAPIYHRDVLLRTPGGQAAALATVRGTVLAARDHPSVLTYSVANEPAGTPDRVPPTARYLRAAARLVRSLDPTLPVSVDVLSYPEIPYQRTLAAFDLLGINSYFGWYPGRPGRSTGRLSALGPWLAVMHRRYPREALVLTEFGAEATQPGPADRKQTYAFQADYLRRTLDIVHAAPFMSGAIYWTLREFAVKPHWDGLDSRPRPGVATDSIHNKGLIAYDGRPKPAFAVAARAFAATPVYAPAGLRVPPAPATVGSWLLIAAMLLALAALGWFDVQCFRALRRDAPPGFVVGLRREAHGDDVAIPHDVVAAFET